MDVCSTWTWHVKNGVYLRESSQLRIQFPISVLFQVCFLQDLIDGQTAFSTIKVHLAAISAL